VNPELKFHANRNANNSPFMRSIGDVVLGNQLETGDVLEPTDVYESTSGRWELCPCPGLTLEASLEGPIWVRPNRGPQ